MHKSSKSNSFILGFIKAASGFALGNHKSNPLMTGSPLMGKVPSITSPTLESWQRKTIEPNPGPALNSGLGTIISDNTKNYNTNLS